ncbi:MAG: hypothetical protein ACKPBB_11255 [Sphaerospermopsis kisseleviana]
MIESLTLILLKAEPLIIHSHTEYGNEKSREIFIVPSHQSPIINHQFLQIVN